MLIIAAGPSLLTRRNHASAAASPSSYIGMTCSARLPDWHVPPFSQRFQTTCRPRALRLTFDHVLWSG